jgi:hypothetical protein
VTRNHNDRIKKKKRLVEEKIIRNVLASHQLNNVECTNQLYKKWFKLHGKKELLSMPFYAIKLKKTTILSFLLEVKTHYFKH